MKDCTNSNAFRNLKQKIKKYGWNDLPGGDIDMALLNYICTLEGQILQLNKRLEDLEKTTDDGK